MSYDIVISTKAKNHTQDSYDYYETEQQQLGERFLRTHEEHYEKLRKILSIIRLYLPKKTCAFLQYNTSLL